MNGEINTANNTRATQAILGWMIGDALGTTFEFTKKSTALQLLEKHNYFRDGLVGQGVFQLAPGQFTDDTELGLANMKIMIKNGSYDQDLVAKMYYAWYLSKPFDIGTATRNCVKCNNAIKMTTEAKVKNASSLSNGFLMRLPGLIALHVNFDSKTLLNAVISDVKLTHTHPETSHIACIYAMMLRNAIQGDNSNEVYAYGKSHCEHSILIQKLYNAVDHNQETIKYNDQIFDLNQLDTNNLGFVGFAFWLMLRAIKKHNSYKDAMLEIVSRGGDSDTNACIVGAVMGALYPDTVPLKWIASVCNCVSERHKTFGISNPKVWMQWLPTKIY